jgi:hypothetical protein
MMVSGQGQANDPVTMTGVPKWPAKVMVIND